MNVKELIALLSDLDDDTEVLTSEAHDDPQQTISLSRGWCLLVQNEPARFYSHGRMKQRLEDYAFPNEEAWLDDLRTYGSVSPAVSLFLTSTRWKKNLDGA